MANDTMAANGVAARHSSDTNEHYSPSAITEAAWAAMGCIDLDPASCAKANEGVRAERYFAAQDNGFTRSWWGRVFLNPPGGRCDVNGVTVATYPGFGKGFWYADGTRCATKVQAAAKTWWYKLAREFACGAVQEAIFVGFSLEILQGTQVDAPEGLLLPLDCALCFPARRVAYVRADGKVGTQPPHASVIVYLGPRPERFRAAFEGLGRVVVPS